MQLCKKQRRSKYAKIPKKHKILFLKKVIEQKEPLKNCADLFRINYSTAKTLIRQYRSDSLELDLTECEDYPENNYLQKIQNLKRCNFKQVSQIQKNLESNVIKFHCGEGLQEGLKQGQKKGYILRWPKKEGKSKAIQIVSQITFE